MTRLHHRVGIVDATPRPSVVRRGPVLPMVPEPSTDDRGDGFDWARRFERRFVTVAATFATCILWLMLLRIVIAFVGAAMYA